MFDKTRMTVFVTDYKLRKKEEKKMQKSFHAYA